MELAAGKKGMMIPEMRVALALGLKGWVFEQGWHFDATTECLQNFDLSSSARSRFAIEHFPEQSVRARGCSFQCFNGRIKVP